MADKLIKIDKNGTKYYASTICRRCGGAGGAEAWKFTGFTCYRCGGSGIDPHPQVYKEYTKEYAQKLEARRRKAQEKKDTKRMAEAERLNKEFYERNGFSADGKTYVALGDSYSKRDELKSKGFRFNRFIGWISPVDVDGVETLELSAEQTYCKDRFGVYDWKEPKKACFFKGEQVFDEDACDRWDWNGVWLVQQANEANAEHLESEYVGEIGERISVEVTLKRTAEWEVAYGLFGSYSNTVYLYIMMDNGGNTFTWKTQNVLGFDSKTESGDVYFQHIDVDRPFTITGRVKDHTIYDGVKQTVLERCKVKQTIEEER